MEALLSRSASSFVAEGGCKTSARGMPIATPRVRGGVRSMQDKPISQPVHDLLCQALETEIGGVAVYQMAVLCAENDDLREEWQGYLEQTERHVTIVRRI